ncbi:uncharacterized protein LOC114952513 [Acropora millepora]|uniref:uncharacterized protein LOC114952513 n=1 Tax=Acropora millepora TaxID=45264 RepID=UPI001CF4C52E|nr:uncharacterized protein LOC114952513 [Acropora millepora]
MDRTLKMSNRTEGCGQWLTARDKRSAKASLAKKGTKPMNKALLQYANHAQRLGALNVKVSCSPLSPRTRKKLKTAKQSNINSYFTTKPPAVTSKSDTNLKFVSESAATSKLEEKQTKIPIKRQRNNAYGDPSFGENEVTMEPHCKQEKCQEESNDQSKFNISGISFLSDSSEELDVLIKDDFKSDCAVDGHDEIQEGNSFCPPHKRPRICEQEGNWRESDQSFTESELSESFHFTQWRNNEIAKCKEIQHKYSFKGDASSNQSKNTFEKYTFKVDSTSEETEYSETPPFQFTQWAKQQVDICQKIQSSKHLSNTPGKEVNDSSESDLLSEVSLETMRDSCDYQGSLTQCRKVSSETTSNYCRKFQEDSESSGNKTCGSLIT